MKKKTKVNKKKLDSLLLILLLTAVLLIMSTYAWFTANRTVTIGSIDVHVNTSSGLLISADGAEWGTSVSLKQIKDAKSNGYGNARNQIPGELSPVSTALNPKEEGLAMFYGIVEQDTARTSATFGKYFLYTDPTKVSTEEDGDNGYYVAFDVFLKSGNDEGDLFMSGDVKEVDKNAEGKYEEVTTERGIANAARVAIIRGETTPDGDTASSVRDLTTRGGEIMMWEPNYDCHTEKSQENANDLYGLTIGAGANNDYMKYTGINKNISEDDKVSLQVAQDSESGNPYFTKITPTWASKKGTEPSLRMPQITVGSEQYGILKGATKYRIYMWVEGQDIDCENNASGSYVQFDLSFSLEAGEKVINVGEQK